MLTYSNIGSTVPQKKYKLFFALTNILFVRYELLKCTRSSLKFNKLNTCFASSANNHKILSKRIHGRSLIKVKESKGLSTEPWGSPRKILARIGEKSLIRTAGNLPSRLISKKETKFQSRTIFWTFTSSTECGTRLKAFSLSKYIVKSMSPLLRLR